MAQVSHVVDGERARVEGADAVWGPGFPREVVTQMTRLVVVSSSFYDPGQDWVAFLAIDEADRVIGYRWKPGY